MGNYSQYPKEDKNYKALLQRLCEQLTCKDTSGLPEKERTFMEMLALQVAAIMDLERAAEIQQQFQLSQESYRELFMNMKEGVAVYQCDEHGNFIFKDLNKAAESIDRVTKQAVLHKDVREVFPGVEDFGLLAIFRQVYETGIPARHPVCQYRDQRISGWRDNDVYKLSSGEVVAVYKDSTFEKQIEEEIWLQREKAQVTLHSIGDGVITTDVQGKIEYMNPVAETLTGWTNEEAQALSLCDVFKIVNEKTGKPALDPVSRCLNEGRIVGLANHTVLINKAGLRFPIEDSASPIRDREGNIIGAVLVFYDVSAKKKMLDKLTFLATHDTLTQIPNRNAFRKCLNQHLMQQSQAFFAILFMDVDRFKFINDTYGHDIGDMLLRKVAERVKRLVNQGDVVCRYGGDEFAILVNSCSDVEAVLATASKIIQKCSQRFTVQKQELYISISMGIAAYPQNGHKADSLLKHADIAMYAAKKSGGNKYQVYLSEEDTKPFKSFSLLGMLNKALKYKELQLHYQPQVYLENGAVRGVEALIRWFSPTGLITPNEFIPLAEDTGLIVPIGEWVIRTACQQGKKWQEEGYEELMMSVNISAKQFYQHHFVTNLQKILAETKLNPALLNIEITESIAMKNFDYASRIIGNLGDLGVKVTIDDFGKGYSSLSYLANLDLNGLKIDKLLIDNLHLQSKKSSVVKGIINIAHNLGLNVVAEGVERSEELEFLKKHQCNMVQGYLLGRPVPAEEVYLK